jgi:hypothetical protein
MSYVINDTNQRDELFLVKTRLSLPHLIYQGVPNINAKQAILTNIPFSISLK